MTDMTNLIAQAVATTDYTQEKVSGGDRELPEEGAGVCRLREYIEIGVQNAATKNFPDKKPCLKARFTFELTTPKHVREIVKDDKSVIHVPHIISIICPVSASEKSNYIKLFRQLNWNGMITHPAQALGKPFLCQIVLAGESKGPITDANPAKYANLQKDGMYTLSPPRHTDPLANTITELKVPELLNPLKLFLWATPTQESWDSLFIDGTYTKDDKEVSKNWLQETILSAIDYETSPLATILGGLGSGVVSQETPSEPVAEQVGTDDPLALLGL